MRLSTAGRLTTSSYLMRWLLVVAGALLAIASFALVPARPAAAAPPAPVEAEGDSYAASATVFLLAGSSINVGPVAPARAEVPTPPNPKFNQSGTVTCNGNCAASAVTNLNVTNDTGKAFVPGYSGAGSSSSTRDCLPNATLPPSLTEGPLTGGNGCSTIANIGLAAGTTVVANAVNSQSLTQSCTGTIGNGGQLGASNVASLSIAGTNIALPSGTIAPNTSVTVNNVPGVLVNLILNEQKFEDLSGLSNTGQTQGHGLIVNAIHVSIRVNAINTAADIIIGHSGSRAVCDSPVTPQCPSDSSFCNGNIISKTVTTPSGIPPGGTTPVAKPGDQIAYTVKIANTDACTPTKVVDTLPPGFTFVSASGDLGAAPAVSTVAGQQTLTFQSPNGFTGADPLVETIVVKVGNVAPGTYVNGVDVISNCGETPGSGGPVLVPASPASPTPTPSLPSNLPNTSSKQAPASPAPLLPATVGIGVLALAMLGWRRMRALGTRGQP